MLFGALGAGPARDRLAVTRLGDARAFCEIAPWGVKTLDDEQRFAADAETGSWLALSGHVDAGPEPIGPGDGAADRMLRQFLADGPEGAAKLDGTFFAVWWDAGRGRLFLLRDRFGIEPAFYEEHGRAFSFASRVRELTGAGAGGSTSLQGLVEFLTWGYVPGDATLHEGIRRVPPGSWIAAEPGRGVVARGSWYRLSFAGARETDEPTIRERFRDLLERAVVRRIGPPPLGVFLSGGMDSSSVVTLARRHYDGPIRTFAFRCAGPSFDESYYARALAAELGAQHTEVEYAEADALRKEEAAAEMDVPFCDIGIVTASWLLADAAKGRVSCVLTGDGGDELWGSHPVYAAQRIVQPYDRAPVPRFLRRGLSALASRLPDSTRKRDWRVLLKRILPPQGLPPALGPFRWRAYFTPETLADLLTPETAAALRGYDAHASVLAAYDGYDGPDDGLSRHLYADYTTASSFYFSRLQLLRRFGVEARCPFYDRDLVEYGARIPARLKLEGVERTKRLFRESMRGVLPAVIADRKDKLGHSVPLKNWLRSNGALQRRVGELLSPERIRRRGLFRPEAVARLFDEHLRFRHNHSHRIWTLYVLEAWLSARGR